MSRATRVEFDGAIQDTVPVTCLQSSSSRDVASPGTPRGITWYQTPPNSMRTAGLIRRCSHLHLPGSTKS